MSVCLLYLSASKRQWPLTVITKYTKCSIYVISPQELVGSFGRLLFDYTTITSFHFSYSHSCSPGVQMSLLYTLADESVFLLLNPLPGKMNLPIDFDQRLVLKRVEETSDLSNDQIKVVIFTLLSNQGRNTLSKSLVHRLLCWLLNTVVHWQLT